jgi:hypothetical protein
MQADLPYPRLAPLVAALSAIIIVQVSLMGVMQVAVLASYIGLFPWLKAFVSTHFAQLIAAHLALTATIYAFVITWHYRVVANASVLQPDPRRMTSKWAVAWWFVPVANLLQPLRSLSQTWNTSVDRSADPTGPATPVVTIWGLFFLAAIVMTLVWLNRMGVFGLAEGELPRRATPPGTEFWTTAIWFTLASLPLIVIVQAITASQMAWARDVGAVTPEGDAVPRTAL